MQRVGGKIYGQAGQLTPTLGRESLNQFLFEFFIIQAKGTAAAEKAAWWK